MPAVAIPYFQKAVRLYPSVWAYRFNLAHAHGRLGDWSQAVDDYQQARDLFPDDYVTHFNLGMALHKMGDEEAAVSEFRKGAELAPSEAELPSVARRQSRAAESPGRRGEVLRAVSGAVAVGTRCR